MMTVGAGEGVDPARPGRPPIPTWADRPNCRYSYGPLKPIIV